MDPAPRPPEFFTSAMSDLRRSRYSSHSGKGQARSPARSPASRTSASRGSSLPIAPIATWPSATTTAPVSVAMSITAAGLKRRAYESASHRIRRPSASVLMISIVLPRWLFTTSPGLTAVPEGRFSVAGMTPTTLSRGLSRPSAANVPSTAAAPDMSNFMSSMFCAGLIEIPPESNVTPFPTSATGGAAPPPQQPPHFLLPHLGPVERAAREAVLVGELLGPVRQIGRRAHVAGEHLEVAGQEMAGRDRFAQPLPGADGLRFLRVARDGDRLDLGLRLFGGGLELGERPGSLRRSLDHDLPHVGGGEAVAGFGGERERELRRAQGAGALRGDGGGASYGGARHVPRLSQPYQQQALRFGAARVEQRRFITLAFEVAARDRACHDSARHAVQLRERRGGGRAALRQRHGEQRRLDLGERCREGRAGHLRHARLCLRRIARSRPPSRRASAGRGRT